MLSRPSFFELTIKSPLAFRNAKKGRPAPLPPTLAITSAPPGFSRIGLISLVNLSSRRHHPHQDASNMRKMFLCSAVACALALDRIVSAEGAAPAMRPAAERRNATVGK